MSLGFPTQESLFAPLLMAIAERGGEICFSTEGIELQEKLADHFSLSEELRRETSQSVNAKGKNVWRNHIQWARAKLVELGRLDNSARNYWKITDAGLQSI